MKRFLSVILSICLLLSITAGLNFSAYAADLPSSGYCGENVTYTFDSETGLLEISGSGDMYYYEPMDGECSEFFGVTGIKTVVINSGVTNIPVNTFYGCSGITSITIHNSVTYIGESAFGYCTGLTEITIPLSLRLIDSRAFYGCSNLNDVYYMGSQTQWNKISTIGNSSGLENAEIHYIESKMCGDDVSYSLDASTGLLEISGKGPMTDYYGGELEDSPFSGKSEIKTIVINEGVTSVGNRAFEWCSELTSVTIPNSVTSIGEGAFAGCTGITSITIPNSVTSIGGSAFYYCTGITSITIPNEVTCIDDDLFYCCSGLTSITIPNSVTSIGDYAFLDCNGLSDVYFIGSPDEWNSIEIGNNNNYLKRAARHYICITHTPGESVLENEVPLTCCADGSYDKVVYCSVCGEEISRKTIVIHQGEGVEAVHTNVLVMSLPTCTQSGYRAYMCRDCGESYIEQYFPKKAHDFGEGEKYCIYGCGTVNPEFACEHSWVLESKTEADCTHSGREHYKCSLCGDEKAETLAIEEHSFVAQIQNATPNSQGYTKYTCPVCGYTYVGDVTDFASDSSALSAVINEAHFYSKSKFSASDIQSIIDEAESYRELSQTNAPQAEYDYAVGEILTAISSVDELATYKGVGIENGEVTIENELGNQKTIQFEYAINEYEAPLDMNGDGIVNAKDFAWLLKHSA